MGLFGDDDFDEIYNPDAYRDFDYNNDGHIDAREASDIDEFEAHAWEEYQKTQEEMHLGSEDEEALESELSDYGFDMSDFLAMNDAKKYKFFQDAILLNEFDYMEYFDDYARISGMDEELIELCEYGIDPYEFEDADDDRKYRMLIEAGLDPEDYEEYFDDFDNAGLQPLEFDEENSDEENSDNSIIITSGDEGMSEDKKVEKESVKDDEIYKLNGDGIFRAGTDFPAGEIQFRVEWDKKPREVYYCLVGNAKKRILYDEDKEEKFSDRLYLTLNEGDYVEFHIIWKNEFKAMYARKVG